jgi:phosphoenolpyruvate synthase/pyruvate phosphate dikinase
MSATPITFELPGPEYEVGVLRADRGTGHRCRRLLTHGAVVARELGIPAVVGAHGATQRIADGAMVTVDGARGVVTLG